MMKKANLLILDEPTNHLDIDSKEVLESALIDYPGTIIFVSHDRYFINKVTDQVAEMNQDGITIYLGDYDYYIEKKQEEAEIDRIKKKEKIEKKKKKKKLNIKEKKLIQSEQRKKERQIVKLEETIDALETELVTLEEEMAEPEIYEDHKKSLELTEKVNKIKLELEQLMD